MSLTQWLFNVSYVATGVLIGASLLAFVVSWIDRRANMKVKVR